MMRANACASGRNSSVEPEKSNSSVSAPAVALRVSASRFACVIEQPFGRPVVPEV
jgi:hypothetical protein